MTYPEKRCLGCSFNVFWNQCHLSPILENEREKASQWEDGKALVEKMALNKGQKRGYTMDYAGKSQQFSSGFLGVKV